MIVDRKPLNRAILRALQDRQVKTRQEILDYVEKHTILTAHDKEREGASPVWQHRVDMRLALLKKRAHVENSTTQVPRGSYKLTKTGIVAASEYLANEEADKEYIWAGYTISFTRNDLIVNGNDYAKSDVDYRTIGNIFGQIPSTVPRIIASADGKLEIPIPQTADGNDFYEAFIKWKAD